MSRCTPSALVAAPLVAAAIAGGAAACGSSKPPAATQSSASQSSASQSSASQSSASQSSASQSSASQSSGAQPASTQPAVASAQPPAIRHVFLVNLENKGYATTFGPASPAPYLSRTLRGLGVLLGQYHGTAHNSLPNYLAQVSGQGPNPQQQADCPVFTPFVGAGDGPATVAPQQAVGSGCVYPASVPTLAGQLTGKGLTWKGYLEDMGADPAREAATCAHPALGAPDSTQHATAKDAYATKHNPFVYFRSITDSPSCARTVVNLTALLSDLDRADSTPNLAYVTPNLCHDGHDSPCANGEPGGLTSADGWLKTWVPRILASPAYRQDGLLVVTFDESDAPQADFTTSGGEVAGPNAAKPGIVGPGGGRVGAVVVSPRTTPGTTSSTGYNHYSLLASIEDIFGLPHLGFAAQPGLPRFGSDVYSAR